jgi:hypothetical protein
MNLGNLNKLIAHLERMKEVKHTKPFNLGEWMSIPVYDPVYGVAHEKNSVPEPARARLLVAQMEGRAENPEDNFKCETVACIAGHAALIASSETDDADAEKVSVASVRYAGRDWLGLSFDQAQALFEPYFVDPDTHDEYGANITSYRDVTIADALSALYHLRDHGYVRYPAYLGPTVIVDSKDPDYSDAGTTFSDGWKAKEEA